MNTACVCWLVESTVLPAREEQPSRDRDVEKESVEIRTATEVKTCPEDHISNICAEQLALRYHLAAMTRHRPPAATFRLLGCGLPGWPCGGIEQPHPGAPR